MVFGALLLASAESEQRRGWTGGSEKEGQDARNSATTSETSRGLRAQHDLRPIPHPGLRRFYIWHRLGRHLRHP